MKVSVYILWHNESRGCFGIFGPWSGQMKRYKEYNDLWGSGGGSIAAQSITIYLEISCWTNQDLNVVLVFSTCLMHNIPAHNSNVWS